MEERGTFSPNDYAGELEAASGNRQLGTSVWFENDHIQVWEVRLDPGERGAFHIHDRTYFWTVVEPGRGKQRLVDGTFVVRDYALGETRYLEQSPGDPLIHDLENVGETTLRFVTVALKYAADEKRAVGPGTRMPVTVFREGRTSVTEFVGHGSNFSVT